MIKDQSFNEQPSPLGINDALSRVASPFPIANIIDQESDSHLINELYRHYMLRFCDTQKMCIGEIFKNDEQLAYCEALDIESARQYCRQIVDERLTQQCMDNGQAKPNLKKLIEAMQSIQNQIDGHCQNLLMTHIKNNNLANTINQLQIKGGFHSTTAVFLSYAEWARLLCDALAYIPPAPSSGKDPYLNMVIHSEETDINASCGLSISLQPDIYEALTHIHPL